MEALRDANIPESYALLPVPGQAAIGVADAEVGEDAEWANGFPHSLLAGTDSSECSSMEGGNLQDSIRSHSGGRWRWHRGDPERRAGSLARKGVLLLAAGVMASALAWTLRPRSRSVADGLAASDALHQAFVSLWSNTCPADNPVVQELRKKPWPNRKKGKAPKVSKVIYINMKWDPVRREYMENQLKNLSHAWRKNVSLTWERLEGIGASHIQKDEAYSDWQQKGFSKAPFPKVAGDWAVAGCTYSHYSAIKKISSDSEELVVIAEDDVEINLDFPAMWEELWRWLPEEWDVVRVGWFGDHQNCSQVVNSYVDLAAWQQFPGQECMYCGAQAYIVNPRSKQKVLKRFEESRITHADALLSAPTPLEEDPSEVPPLKAFAVWPLLAKTYVAKNGFPAFQSDRIHGRQAVGTTTVAAEGAEDQWLPSTKPPTTTKNPYVIHWPTTTTSQEEPEEPEEPKEVEEHAAEEAQRAAARAKREAEEAAKRDAKEAARTQAELAHVRAKAAAAADEMQHSRAKLEAEAKRLRGELKAARQQAEASEAAADEAQEAATKAQARAHEVLRRKAGQLAQAAEKRVEEKTRQAEQKAAEQVEKETKEAEEAAQEASREVSKRMKAAEEDRKKAEQKAKELAQQATEAAKQAEQASSQADIWKKAEEQAEVAQKEASKRADESEAMAKQAAEEVEEAKDAQQKAEGQAAQMQLALKAAEEARKKAEEEMQEEAKARQKAESELAEEAKALQEVQAERKKAQESVKRERQREKDYIMTPKTLGTGGTLAPLPGAAGTLLPLPELPTLSTLAPLPTLPPMATLAPPATLAPLPAVTVSAAPGLPAVGLLSIPHLPGEPQGGKANVMVKK